MIVVVVVGQPVAVRSKRSVLQPQLSGLSMVVVLVRSMILVGDCFECGPRDACRGGFWGRITVQIVFEKADFS